MQQNSILLLLILLLFILLLGITLVVWLRGRSPKARAMNANVFHLVASALFVAISVILAQFRFYIPLFGFPSVRFSISEVPIFLAGSLFGPIYGAMVGFASDIISFILASSGAYHFGFTLNAMLVGFIPGVVFYLIRKKQVSIAFDKMNKILAGIALIGALIYINFIGIYELDEVITIMGMPINIVLSILMIVLVIALSFVVVKLKNIYSNHEGFYSIDKLIFIACINYIAINLMLTPIWLLQLYNIPMVASISVRIFKSLIDVPLQVIVIYSIIHAIPRSVRERWS